MLYRVRLCSTVLSSYQFTLEAFQWSPGAEIRARLEECREKMAAACAWRRAAYGGIFGPAAPEAPARDLTQLPEAWLELLIAGRLQRLTVALYLETPRCLENFQRLCEGSLQGSVVHRVVPGCLVEAGDVLRGDGTAGRAAVGESFQEEGPTEHHKRGLLVMMKQEKGYDSRFRITLRSLPELSGLVFGEVVDSEALVALEKVETVYPDRPKETIRVVRCGVKRALLCPHILREMRPNALKSIPKHIANHHLRIDLNCFPGFSCILLSGPSSHAVAHLAAQELGGLPPHLGRAGSVAPRQEKAACMAV